MKPIKNVLIIALAGAVGMAVLVGFIIDDHLTYRSPPDGYTARQIEEMAIRPIDINTATAEQLSQLTFTKPQAQSIVEYREQHGNFSCVDELLNVNGIGKLTLDKLKPYVTAEP